MSRSHDVVVGDENATAFVFGKQAEPGGFFDQNLPRPFAELGTFAANDSARFDLGTNATFWNKKNINNLSKKVFRDTKNFLTDFSISKGW